MRRFLASVVASSVVLSAAVAHAETPAGYHIEEHPRYALAITGGALAAAGATMFTYGYFERREVMSHNGEGLEGSPGSGGEAMMYGGAIMGAVGVPLLLVGLLSKKSVLVRDDVAITPVASTNFGGFAVAATF
jgi:hypothetical protein